VWSKAVKDTAGLRQFYEQNKNKYLWKERADVKIYKCADEKTATEIRKLLNKKKTEKEIHEIISKKNPLLLTSYSTTIFKGENATADKYWKPGIVPENHKDDDKERPYSIIIINKIIPETPKTLLEAKGQVTADYQNYLETEWINYLKKKYPVEINSDILKTIQ
jgi:peptidyl-prolyl cis-trans isomerase SurA